MNSTASSTAPDWPEPSCSNSGPSITSIRGTTSQDKVIQKSQSKIVVIGFIAFCTLLLLGWLARVGLAWLVDDATVSRESLRFATVDVHDLIRDVASQGVIVAAKSPTMYAPAGGTLDFTVASGDEVKVGDRLATIENLELHNTLQQEKATLAALDTALKRLVLEHRQRILLNQQRVDLAGLALSTADRELARAQRSQQLQVISAQDFALVEDRHRRALVESRHVKAESEIANESLQFELEARHQDRQRQVLHVEELERQLASLEIRSPVNGQVGELLAEQRARVDANSPLIRVIDLSAFEVDARIAESYGDELQIGMAAQILLNQQEYPTVIRAISPQVNAGQVALRLRFTEPAPAGLRQNQRVSARIILREIPNTLTVKRGAFLQSDGGRFAYKVNPESTHATKIPIKVGATSINQVQIVDGLAAGDRIVISSTEEFRHTHQFRIVP